ncbi:helix-turn-helix domain-containing protein [Neisseria bacilliformis]|uniref:helix-turn-helix domain-containing protein n=1 Tax=Neisseria bacilliformis TaxID=267212 RepID=UPI0036F25166
MQAWLTRRYTKTELCRQFNISRPTADKWIKRHQQVGFDGLAELSRRPKHSPNATPQWISEGWLPRSSNVPIGAHLTCLPARFPSNTNPQTAPAT